MQDALRAYLELALGVTEASRKRATKVIESLVGKGGEFVGKGGVTAKQVQALAAELVTTSTANREALANLVRFEVDRALGAVGLATADEVDDLTNRVRDLERQLGEAEAKLAVGGPGRADGRTAAAKQTAAKQTVASQAATGQPVAKKAVAKKAVAKKTAKKATAKATPPARSPAKKTAKKATKKAAPGRARS